MPSALGIIIVLLIDLNIYHFWKKFSVPTRNGSKQGLLNTPRKICLSHSLKPTQFKSAIRKNINSTSTSCTRLRYSYPYWHVTSLFELYLLTSLFELYLCFVAGHVPYKLQFQRNPVSSIRNHNSRPNANVYLSVYHHTNMYALT